jgi:hypothetical protein
LPLEVLDSILSKGITVESHIRHTPRKGILYDMAYILIIPDLVCGKIKSIRHTFLKGLKACHFSLKGHSLHVFKLRIYCPS